MASSPHSRQTTTPGTLSISSITSTSAYYQQLYTQRSKHSSRQSHDTNLPSTTHHQYHRATSTPPTILALYYDKAKHNTHLKQSLNAMDISDRSSLAHIYHKAWNIVTISLLQCARNVHHIIHALIYQQHRKSNLTIPATPKRTLIPQPTCRKFTITVLESHRFTSHTSGITNTPASTQLVEPTAQRQCTHPLCTLADRLKRTTGAAQVNDIYCQQCHMFNYAAHHTTRLERAVTSGPHLRKTLAQLMYRPRSNTQHVQQSTVNDIIIQHSTQSLTEIIRILHIIHSSTQLNTSHPSLLTPASHPILTAMRFLARTLNISTTYDIFTNPITTPEHYHAAYTNAATICP